MADPVTFTIRTHAQTWLFARDGRHVADFSHLEQATHEAVRLARELDETGEPARVLVEAANGRTIEIDVDPQVTQAEELRGPEIAR